MYVCTGSINNAYSISLVPYYDLSLPLHEYEIRGCRVRVASYVASSLDCLCQLYQ
jgi:hypothetical protein